MPQKSGSYLLFAKLIIRGTAIFNNGQLKEQYLIAPQLSSFVFDGKIREQATIIYRVAIENNFTRTLTYR